MKIRPFLFQCAQTLGAAIVAALLLGSVSAQSVPQPTTACSGARNSVSTACLVGEYSLTRNAETGASLILSDDNRFEWFYSDLTGQKYATGRWQSGTGGVVLTADQPSISAPVFELVSQEPWNETAEFRLRASQRDVAQAVVEAQCPVFIGTSISQYEPPRRAEPSAVANTNAAAALNRSLAAKRNYESAVERAVTARGDQKAALVEAAEQARGEFHRAGFNLVTAYQIAGLPIPQQSKPVLPAVCTVPEAVNTAILTPAQWLRGISINIDNVGSRFLVSGMDVNLIYINGPTKSLTTASTGLAFAPFQPNSRLTGIEISAPAPNKRTRRFAVVPTAQGVFNFSVNGDLLNGPPFAQMRLRKAGKALVSSAYLPGRYERIDVSN